MTVHQATGVTGAVLGYGSGGAVMRPRWLRVVAGVVLGAAVVAGMLWFLLPREPPVRPRLVLLYAPCTVNRAFLSPYDAAVGYTPHLAAFARDGLVFTKQQSESSLSGVAYAALVTGTQADRHGVYHHPQALDDRLYTITEAFRDGGYTVFVWADHGMASPDLNFAQGADPTRIFWNPELDPTHGEQNGTFLRADDQKFRAMLDRLRDAPTARAFVLTTFSVTHTPYNPLHLDDFCRAYASACAGLTPEERQRYTTLFLRHNFEWQYDFENTVTRLGLSAEDIRNLIRTAGLLYASNVSHLDRLFGDVLHAIDEHGLTAESLVAFTADHGERMYTPRSFGNWTHGFALSPETLLVPWILRGPGVRPGRYDGVTRSIDVFPTLAGLSGLTLPPDTVTGVDLAPVVEGREAAPPLIAFSHTAMLADAATATTAALNPALRARLATTPSAMAVTARHGDRVYTLEDPDGRGMQPFVYDPERDPRETRNLYDPADDAQRAAFDQLRTYKQRLVDAYDPSAPRPLTDEQVQRMRALGYIQP